MLTGGHNLYGHRIGILMIEGRFPRPSGTIGNASSFPFPVIHHVVKGFSGSRTVRDLGSLDPTTKEFQDAVQPWVDGARFIIDRHPANETVWLLGGGSGHGFKHGPAIGEMVTDLMLKDGEPKAIWRLDRFKRG